MLNKLYVSKISEFLYDPFIKLFSCNHLYDTLFWFVQEYADGFIHNS